MAKAILFLAFVIYGHPASVNITRCLLFLQRISLPIILAIREWPFDVWGAGGSKLPLMQHVFSQHATGVNFILFNMFNIKSYIILYATGQKQTLSYTIPKAHFFPEKSPAPS